MNTIKATFGPRILKGGAQQPKTPMVGAGSLIASHNGELREVITVRTYFSEKGSGMQPVRACVWVSPSDRGADRPSGRGSASGHGYHKESAAIADAVSACGISLHGKWSERSTDPAGPLRFGSTGSTYYPDVFKAIARAAGYRGRMVWVSHGL